MKNYLLALSFLTIIPVPFVPFGRDGRELTNSAAAFPLAGATLGLIMAGVSWLLIHLFPPAPVAVMALIMSFLLTRGLHFDGLADTADGLIGTINREKAFKAMEDSAVGVMGAATLFFVCLLKFSLLAALGSVLLPLALLVMPLAGRWAIVYAGAWFAPARNRGLGDLFLRGLRWPVLLKASLAAIFLLAVFSLWKPYLAASVLAGSILALASAHLLAFYASRRLGGISGDILGAASELGELFFLIGFYLAADQSGAAELTFKAVISFVQGI
jgi:adenosylcobinamide-GDP ribazoletransferase